MALSRIRAAWRTLAGDFPVGLYVHIPFCESRCSFCYTLSVRENDPGRLEGYLTCLEWELELLRLPPKLKISTLYLGGGTPSLLTAAQLQRLMRTISAHMDLGACEEKLAELNPGSVTGEKMRTLKGWSFNAVTIGVQTVDARVLRRVGRSQDRASVEKAFELARKAGIPRVGVDLMTGLPGQTLDSCRDSLDFILKLKPDSICVNPFYPNSRTPLARGGLSRVPLDPRERQATDRWMQETIDRELPSASENGSRPANLQAFHAKDRLGAILGIGYGAVSHAPFGVWYGKKGTLADYENRLRARRAPAFFGAGLSSDDEMRGYAVWNLQSDGRVSRRGFRRLFKVDFERAFPLETAALERSGRACARGDAWSFKTESRLERNVLAKLFYGADARRRILGADGLSNDAMLGEDLHRMVGI